MYQSANLMDEWINFYYKYPKKGDVSMSLKSSRFCKKTRVGL